VSFGLAQAQAQVPSTFKDLVNQAFQAPELQVQVEDLVMLEADFIKILRIDSKLKAEAPFFALNLAELYLRQQSPQEALWALERGGLYAHAQYLADFYQHFLSTEPIVGISRIVKGITKSHFVVFQNGMMGVLKSRDPGERRSVESEIWAYRFDRKFGFNLVPVAIEKEIDGEVYSLHAFVKGAAESQVDFIRTPDSRFPEIQIFDFLTRNGDRKSENAMFTSGLYLFGIDHGRIQATDRTLVLSPAHPPPPRLLKSLKSFDAKQMKDIYLPLSDLMTERFWIAQVDLLRQAMRLDALDLNGVALRPHQSNDRRKYQVQIQPPTDVQAAIRQKFERVIERSTRALRLDNERLASKAVLSDRNLSGFLKPQSAVERAFSTQNWSELDSIIETARSSPDALRRVLEYFKIATQDLLARNHEVSELEKIVLKHSLVKQFLDRGSLVFRIAATSSQIRDVLIREIDDVPADRKQAALRDYVEYTFNLQKQDSNSIKDLIAFLGRRTGQIADPLSLIDPRHLKSLAQIRLIEKVLVQEPLQTSLLKVISLAAYFYDFKGTGDAIQRFHLFEQYLSRQEERLPYDMILARIHSSPARDELLGIFQRVLFDTQNHRMGAQYAQFLFLHQRDSEAIRELQEIQQRFSSKFSVRQTFAELNDLIVGERFYRLRWLRPMLLDPDSLSPICQVVF